MRNVIYVTDAPLKPKTLCHKSTKAALIAFLQTQLGPAYDHLVGLRLLPLNPQRAEWVARVQREWQSEAAAGVPEDQRLNALRAEVLATTKENAENLEETRNHSVHSNTSVSTGGSAYVNHPGPHPPDIVPGDGLFPLPNFGQPTSYVTGTLPAEVVLGIYLEALVQIVH
jgi:hypothetical protein